MKERAMEAHSVSDGRRQTALNAWRFGPLCHLGYTVSGRDGEGFTATDPATGKEIRRITFDAFAKAVRKAGLTRAARGRVIATRKTPDGKLRDRVERQRLTLLAMERREVCPSKPRPAPRPSRAPVTTARRPRMNLCRN